MAPPIAQKKLLRKSKFQHFDAITLWCEKQLVVPAVVEASDMQPEILVTFALPLPAGVRAGIASRCSEDGSQRTDSFSKW
jgi:hypothetical protein